MNVYAVQFSGSFVDQAQGLVHNNMTFKLPKDHQMSRIEESVAQIRSSAKHYTSTKSIT